MALIQIANNFSSTLAGNINADDTELILTDVTNHPNHSVDMDFSYLTIIDLSGNIEIVKVTKWVDADNKAIVVRGQEGTLARVFDAGSKVGNRPTAATMLTYLESWYTRITDAITRISATQFSVLGDQRTKYMVNRALRSITDTDILNHYITTAAFDNTKTTVTINSADLPDPVKVLELGPDVNWLPRLANAQNADHAVNADLATSATKAEDSDKLGGQLHSFYTTKEVSDSLKEDVDNIRSIRKTYGPELVASDWVNADASVVIEDNKIKWIGSPADTSVEFISAFNGRYVISFTTDATVKLMGTEYVSGSYVVVYDFSNEPLKFLGTGTVTVSALTILNVEADFDSAIQKLMSDKYLKTAAYKNVGTGPDDVPTNSNVQIQLPFNGIAQSIIKATTGLRPKGWTYQECDAPVCSIIVDRLLPHTTYYGQSGIVSASSEYSSTYPAWKAVNGTAVDSNDSWSAQPNSFIGGSGDEYIEYSFMTPRAFNIFELTSINYVNVAQTSYPKEWELLVDGVVVHSETNDSTTGPAVKKQYTLATPVTAGKVCKLHITKNNGHSTVNLAGIDFDFTDVPAGSIHISSGLQVSYVDEGKVKLSKELSSPLAVDISALSDGTHYVSVNPDADGNLISSTIAAIAPEVGLERITASADLYNPITLTNADGTDAAIRRVPIGYITKAGGKVSAVNCYALGDFVEVPVNNGDMVLDDTVYTQDLPFIVYKRSTYICSVEAEGIMHPIQTMYMHSNGTTRGVEASSIGKTLTTRTQNYLLDSAITPTYSGAAVYTSAPKCSVYVKRGY